MRSSSFIKNIGRRNFLRFRIIWPLARKLSGTAVSTKHTSYLGHILKPKVDPGFRAAWINGTYWVVYALAINAFQLLHKGYSDKKCSLSPDSLASIQKIGWYCCENNACLTSRQRLRYPEKEFSPSPDSLAPSQTIVRHCCDYNSYLMTRPKNPWFHAACIKGTSWVE